MKINKNTPIRIDGAVPAIETPALRADGICIAPKRAISAANARGAAGTVDHFCTERNFRGSDSQQTRADTPSAAAGITARAGAAAVCAALSAEPILAKSVAAAAIISGAAITHGMPILLLSS
jgi:hypothetical protein